MCFLFLSKQNNFYYKRVQKPGESAPQETSTPKFRTHLDQPKNSSNDLFLLYLLLDLAGGRKSVSSEYLGAMYPLSLGKEGAVKVKRKKRVLKREKII